MTNLDNRTIVKQRQTYPAYFPTFFSEPISEWINEVEKLFKQPIKNIFPYPMDIIKVFDKETGKLKNLVFEVALAGITKDEIKVQFKNKKFLTISIQRNVDRQAPDGVEEYVTKGISYRDSEVSFRIIPEIDMEKFTPTFVNGLLSIKLFVKEQPKDADVFTAEIQ